MLVHFLKSKIHRVKVTQAELNYVGSITLDEDLIDAASMFVGEKVQIVNLNNGERLETYIICGERGSGIVCLNGPAARKAAIGDLVIVISYAMMEDQEARRYTPIIVFPDAHNKLKAPKAIDPSGFSKGNVAQKESKKSDKDGAPKPSEAPKD